MKRFFLFVLLIGIAVVTYPQAKTHGRVKKKFQRADTENTNLPTVFVHGRVLNADREKLAGASVVIWGTSIGVNTNEEGEYFLRGVPSGKISLQVSFVGYRTKVIDYIVHQGNNDIYVTLDRDAVSLQPVTVTSQLREQQLLDIPTGVNVVSGLMLESNQINEMSELANFIPGLAIREQTPHRPNYVIRGMTSDEVSVSSQPRVSVYFNNDPVSRGSMASAELYDMERVEVLKGPQGTLFSRGSQAGVIHYITNKPVWGTEGYLSAGYGTYQMKEVKGAYNFPVIPKKLTARAAGIYTYRDGYVENTFGGKLNGKNTLGGRVSLRYLPFWNTKVDLVVNYQKDDLPGTAFMSRQFPNVNGISDIFQYQASLEQGKNLKNLRDILGTSLEIKRYRNENNYLTSMTSWYTNHADSRWDGDGTQAPAIDMAEKIHVRQFTQDIRYNFSKKSRLNGTIGASYWREKVEQTYWFSPNEQYMAYLILQKPQYLVSPDGTTFPWVGLPNDPQLGPLAGMPLPSNHQEENVSGATNQAADLFLDATWRISRRLHFTGGIRGTWENFRVSNQSEMTGGDPSVLGMLTGMYPDLFFKVTDKTKVNKSWMALTSRASLSYELRPDAGVFLGYSKGRRPHVIQFNSQGNSEIMNQEILNSFDAGFKTAITQRLWIDLTAFYQLFNNFQTNAWVDNNYLVRDAGKATSYGAETSVKAALLKILDIYGNYSYIHSRFDKLDSQGNAQEYAGNSFRLTPENSYTLGLNVKIPLARNVRFFLDPYYTWKSHIWFEDANTPGLDQNAFGLLYANTGFSWSEPAITLSFSGSNLLDEKYLISAGNTGSLFGVPTFVPGAPRMFGARITWKF